MRTAFIFLDSHSAERTSTNIVGQAETLKLRLLRAAAAATFVPRLLALKAGMLAAVSAL